MKTYLVISFNNKYLKYTTNLRRFVILVTANEGILSEKKKKMQSLLLACSICNHGFPCAYKGPRNQENIPVFTFARRLVGQGLPRDAGMSSGHKVQIPSWSIHFLVSLALVISCYYEKRKILGASLSCR